MKKWMTVMMLTSLLMLTACGSQTSRNPGSETAQTETAASETVAETSAEADSTSEADTMVDGGWGAVQNEEISQEVAAAIKEAGKDLDGASYEPVKLLAQQVVGGMNYAVLCRITPDDHKETGSYCVIYVYHDLQGEAEVTRVRLFVESAEEDTTGGWSSGVGEETAAAAKEALKKAAEEMTGAVYEPEAVLSSQIVAGTNYLILCKVTAVTPDQNFTYDLVTVYEDPEGKAEITDVTELTF